MNHSLLHFKWKELPNSSACTSIKIASKNSTQLPLLLFSFSSSIPQRSSWYRRHKTFSILEWISVTRFLYTNKAHNILMTGLGTNERFTLEWTELFKVWTRISEACARRQKAMVIWWESRLNFLMSSVELIMLLIWFIALSQSLKYRFNSQPCPWLRNTCAGTFTLVCKQWKKNIAH